MKNYAPSSCPSCGDWHSWWPIHTESKGFSAGKAIGGAVLFGPLGLAAGALGNVKDTYYCKKCGFRAEYDKR